MEKEFHVRLSEVVDELYSNLRLMLYYPILDAAYNIEPLNKYSRVQLSILRLISIHDGSMLLRDVAEYEKLSVFNISKILNPMELVGLIERKHAPGNKVMLSITQEGKDIVNGAENMVTEKSMALFNENMSDEKQQEMFRLVTELSDFLKNNPISPSKR